MRAGKGGGLKGIPQTIHLRRRVQNGGKISLYFEYYYGRGLLSGGKMGAIRDYEYPQLFLIAEPKTRAEKNKNKEIEELALTILAQKHVEVKKGEFGFKGPKGKGVRLLDYFSEQMHNRKENAGNHGNWRGALKHLTDYVKISYYPEIGLRDIDAGFVEGYKTYLCTQAIKSTKEPICSSSQNSYFAKLKACLRQALKEDLLMKNPAEGVALPRIASAQRSYLTFEELQALAKAECRYDVLRRAFLFSCITGLRWSDIQKLFWREVQVFGDGWRIIFRQQKTKGMQYLDISSQARELLGEMAGADDRVFIGLKYSSYMNVALSQWVLRAGITKKITFHCARHTYATLQINLGTDILTLSKMLGHSAIKTTEIYAQIMDEKKRDAATRIPRLEM